MTASCFLGSAVNGWFQQNPKLASNFPPGSMRFRRTPAMSLFLTVALR
jgi:hypothetical protein